MKYLNFLRVNFFRRKAARRFVLSRRLLVLLSRLSLVMGALSANSSMAVDGGNVVAGQAAVISTPGTTTINQTSDRAAINWNNFNIGQGEKVQFNQPGADSATLNRVVGAGQTTINGILNANGRVFIVNPSGVVFGKGASVDVGALTATTLGIGNEAFMQGGNNLQFTSTGNTIPGFVKVEAGAQITAKSFVALLAENVVSNAGVITAGTDPAAKERGIAMVAGTAASTIHLGGFDVTVDQQSMDALVANSGDLVIGESMRDGSILLNATGRNALMRSLLSSSGKITNNSRGVGSSTTLTSGGGLSHVGDIQAAAGKVNMRAPEIAIDGNVTVGDETTVAPNEVNIGGVGTEHVTQGVRSVITANSQSHGQINVEANKVLKLSGELLVPTGEIALKSTILDTGLLVAVADKVSLSGIDVWTELPLKTANGLKVYLGKDGYLHAEDGRQLAGAESVYDEIDGHDVGTWSDVIQYPTRSAGAYTEGGVGEIAIGYNRDGQGFLSRNGGVIVIRPNGDVAIVGKGGSSTYNGVHLVDFEGEIIVGHVDPTTLSISINSSAFSNYLSFLKYNASVANTSVSANVSTVDELRSVIVGSGDKVLGLLQPSMVGRIHFELLGSPNLNKVIDRLEVLKVLAGLTPEEKKLLTDPIDAAGINSVSELMLRVLPALERHDITIANKTGDAAKVYDAPNQKLMDRDRTQLPDGTQVMVTVHKWGSSEQVSGEATIRNGQLELPESLKQKMTDYDISSNYQTTDMQQVYMDRLTGKLAKKDGTDFAKGTKILLMTQAAKTNGLVVGVNGKPLAQAGATNPTPVALDEASIHSEVEAWNKKNPENLRHADQEITQAKLESSSVFRVHNPVTHIETLVSADLIPLTQVMIKNDLIEIVLCAQVSGTQVQVLMNNKGEALNLDTFDVQPNSLVVKTYSPTTPHPTAWVVVRSDRHLVDPSSFQSMIPELKLVDVSVSGIDHESLVITNDNEVFEPSTIKPSLPKITLTKAIGLDGTERNFLSSVTQELVQLTKQSPKARLVYVTAAIPHSSLPIMVTADLRFHP